jgi:hypothetical protein
MQRSIQFYIILQLIFIPLDWRPWWIETLLNKAFVIREARDSCSKLLARPYPHAYVWWRIEKPSPHYTTPFVYVNLAITQGR